jgi:dienelactone hydrolase
MNVIVRRARLVAPLTGTARQRAAAAILLAFVLALLAACSPQRATEAVTLLEDIAAAGAPTPGQKPEGEDVARRSLRYRTAETWRRADLYEAAEPSEAALVLVPGAARGGKDDPRFRAFAGALARAGFLVLAPEIENLRELKVTPEDSRPIGDAIRYLSQGEDGVDGEAGAALPIGIVAISYAAGPAVIAALQEELRSQVCFLLLIGPYYDVEAAIRFFTTGYYRETADLPWRHMQPNSYGKWVFLRSNLERLSAPQDRDLLDEIAGRKQRDPAAAVDDLAGRLGPEGRAVYALVENKDPERVGELIAGLPEAIRRDVVELDLKARDVTRLAGHLLLVHGRDDRIIPASESQAFAAALPEERVDLYLVDNLAHVELGPGDLSSALTLWQAAYRLLTLRDAPPARCRRPPTEGARQGPGMPRTGGEIVARRRL